MDRQRVWNNLNSDRRLHLENASFTLPIETVAVNGVNSLGYLDFPPRPNTLSRFRSEVPHFTTHSSENSGYHQHSTAAASSSSISLNRAQQGFSYSRSLVNREEGGNMNPQVNGGRVSHKRKNPAVTMSCDGRNANGYYCGGSSSGIPISADHIQQKRMSGSLHWPRDPSGTFPDYRSNNLCVMGERSQRNVRSRYTGPLNLEANLPGAHFSSNMPNFHSTVDFPGPSMTGQWSHSSVPAISHGRIPSTGIPGYSPEVNLLPAQNGISSVSSEWSGSYHQNLILGRNMGAPLQTLHGPSGGTGVGYSGYDQRAGFSHRLLAPSVGYTTTSLEYDGRSVPGVFSRHSRPLTVDERRHGGNDTRPRSTYGRFQSYLNEDAAHGGRWVSGGIVMDQSVYYDSSDLFDQHHRMRLDIDNMSYEELLALGERIGNVNTGLSKDVMPKCLTETTYCSDQIQEDIEERKCAICLEGYEDGEELGTLHCGHDYHAGCIKEWLLVKNICPICKAEALKDTSKEKSFLSL